MGGRAAFGGVLEPRLTGLERDTCIVSFSTRLKYAWPTDTIQDELPLAHGGRATFCPHIGNLGMLPTARDAASVEEPRGPRQQRLAALAEGGHERSMRLRPRLERLVAIDPHRGQELAVGDA